MQDYVAPEPLEARRCAASGTKFFDRNANGVRDPGEPGLPRFVIFADYDGDGVRDAAEPFAVTDDGGRYVIDDIRPPSGSYTLRETFLPGRRVVRRWRCSYPRRWRRAGSDAATGRSASLPSPTPGAGLRQLVPGAPEGRQAARPGRGSRAVRPARERRRDRPSRGDGASRTIAVAPGTYGVAERAVPPTDPAGYRSTVECKLGTRRAVRRAGTTSSIALLAGDNGVCIFRNARLNAPAIAIDKTGPATAEAGARLRYTLYVENIGAVPFPASAVDVTDADCDTPPELDGKSGDTSPGTLDPGDVGSTRARAPPMSRAMRAPRGS